MVDKNHKTIPKSISSIKFSAIFDGATGLTLILMEIYAFIQGGDFEKQIILIGFFFLVTLAVKWFGITQLSWEQIEIGSIAIFFLPIFIGAVLTFVLYFFSFRSINAQYVAKDFVTFGRILPSVSNYGTNAQVIESSIYKSTEELGPEYFLRLDFNLFCDEDDHDCDAGWILYNLGGFDASDSSFLVFDVRGEKGGEQFGIGIKDTRSTEVKLFDIADYLPASTVTVNWQTARVPFNHFRSRGIDLMSLQNVSIFVDAQFSDQRKFQFDIANFRLD